MGRDGFRRSKTPHPCANDDGLLQNRIGHRKSPVERGLAAQFSTGREAERTQSTLSAPRYGRISGIGYCVTRVTRRRTAKGPSELSLNCLAISRRHLSVRIRPWRRRHLGVDSSSAEGAWLFVLLMSAAKSEGRVPPFVPMTLGALDVWETERSPKRPAHRPIARSRLVVVWVCRLSYRR
jgi:hypothetical protein